MKEAEGWYAYDFDASKIKQGTILLGSTIKGLSGKYYVVLNPECDLAHDKSEYINLVAQGDLREALEDILSDFGNLEEAHWSGLKTLPSPLLNKIVRKLTDQINGRHGARWFFVPSDYRLDGLPLLVFDLQQIYTLDKTSLPDLLSTRKAILCSPYKEALVTRLYSYLTRVGTDDVYKQDLCFAILGAVGLRIPESPPVEGTAPTVTGPEVAGDVQTSASDPTGNDEAAC